MPLTDSIMAPATGEAPDDVGTPPDPTPTRLTGEVRDDGSTLTDRTVATVTGGLGTT